MLTITDPTFGCCCASRPLLNCPMLRFNCTCYPAAEQDDQQCIMLAGVFHSCASSRQSSFDLEINPILSACICVVKTKKTKDLTLCESTEILPTMEQPVCDSRCP